MFEDLRNKLVSHLPNEVWDVVVYGSAARGKTDPRDIDIAVIIKRTETADNKLKLSQRLRKLLSNKPQMDVKVIDMADLLDSSFLARQAILAEGYSLIYRTFLAYRFGFKPYTYIKYSLGKLTPSKKKMVYYALQGRKKGAGVLAKLGGAILSKGMLRVPTKHIEVIKSLLEQNNVEYKVTFVLTY